MKELFFTADSLADTDRLGAALAECLPDGTVVCLCGALGAGKTKLVQSLASHCGVAPGEVVSPTFVLCQTYFGNRSIAHFDAYRLKDDDEFLELGPEEFFDSLAITLVEWGDRVAACLPVERVTIDIEITGDQSRRFHLVAIGAAYETAISRIARGLGEV